MTESHFLSALEAGGPRSRFWLLWFLELSSWLPSHGVLTFPGYMLPVREGGGRRPEETEGAGESGMGKESDRKRDREKGSQACAGVFSYKDTNPTRLEPHPVTLASFLLQI